MTDQEFQAVVTTMQHWGFAAFSPFHSHSPGHRVLAVAMRPQPTKAHFDPEVMTLVLAASPQGTTPTPAIRNFHHDTPADGSYWVCPGRVILRDRLDKSVEYYTFGAQMRVQLMPAASPWVLYVLESSAPIIPLPATLSLDSGTQLVDEVEALFARLRPDERRNGGSHHGDVLGDELIYLAPVYIYAGCIEYLYAKYHRTPVLQHMFPALFQLLQHELAWVRDSLGGSVPDIHTLLRNPPPAARRVDSPSSGAYTSSPK